MMENRNNNTGQTDGVDKREHLEEFLCKDSPVPWKLGSMEK